MTKNNLANASNTEDHTIEIFQIRTLRIGHYIIKRTKPLFLSTRRRISLIGRNEAIDTTITC